VVLDVVDPLKPIEICSISPANGGRFISASRIAFWSAQDLGLADLALGAAVGTETLPALPSDAAFSSDGSMFAYHVGSDTNGMSTHLNAAGVDRTLLTRPAIGGHGGAPYGPATQLEFSADARYLLSVDSLFANFGSGPPNFLIYRTDGSIAFQSSRAEYGAWGPGHSKLYFFVSTERGAIAGDVHSWDPSVGEGTVAQAVSSYFWPRVAPDGRAILFDSYDKSAPGEATGGLPHLWRLDLATGATMQLSTAISSRTVFVGDSVVWADKEQRCSCGPGGASAPTGEVLAHDLLNGQDTVLDLTPFTASPSPVSGVLAVWSS
jgi:hypothetical protein